MFINAKLQENNSNLFVEQKTIRSKSHQLIWKSRGEPEFYNVIDDPFEVDNLYSKNSEKAELMGQQLIKWFKTFSYIPPSKSDVTDVSVKENQELLERLRTLGYVR